MESAKVPYLGRTDDFEAISVEDSAEKGTDLVELVELCGEVDLWMSGWWEQWESRRVCEEWIGGILDMGGEVDERMDRKKGKEKKGRDEESKIQKRKGEEERRMEEEGKNGRDEEKEK